MSAEIDKKNLDCEQIRESYYDYRLMAEESADVVMLHDLEGRIRTSEVALRRLLGLGIADIDERRFLHFVHPDDIEAVQALRLCHVIDNAKTAAYRVRHPDGRELWMETTARPLHDGVSGALTGFISTTRDITERKIQELALLEAQQRAEAANLAKSQFLANMSHELRTPLNAIIGFTDLMRMETFGPMGNPHYADYATMIYDSGQLLLDLITDILDMARIEAGKLQLNLERVDISGAVDDCIRLLRVRASKTGIAVDAELPEMPVILTADKRAIKQILLNLISNAIKFTQPAGHVEVALRQESDHVCIVISDDGIGIPADLLPRIGQPFEQVSSDPHLSKGGSGLGLALVRLLAEKHDGTLHIESQEGFGTTVTVTLPIRAAQAAA